MAAPTDENKFNIPPADGCSYTKCYCEENVWKLCEHVKESVPEKLNDCHAVFISNHNKTIPLWKQKASKSPDQPVVWDYHVIFLHHNFHHCHIYDLDTTLEFPSIFSHYCQEAIGTDSWLKPEFHRYFRVIPAAQYLEKFASDRSHMLKEDKTWMAPPPDYPCICTIESTNNISDFISMDPSVGYGDVLSYDTFTSKFGPYPIK